MYSIEKIKAENAMEVVAGRYVRLTVRGYRATGLCPFHDDHHPSLQIDIRKQNFICYACGAKGDVIEFVQKIENCSFTEALKKLSPHMANATRGKQTATNQQTPVQATPTLKPSRIPTRPFIPMDKRMLMPYYPGCRELMNAYLDFEVEEACRSIHHPMRGRIIFPIRDEEGTLKGYSGRTPQPPEGGVLESQDITLPSGGRGGAKYLNTSSAEGFFKNTILYGLYRAKAAIRSKGYAFLTEGFKDAVAMHAAGFTNAVALMGKDLSRAQLELLQKYTAKVCLVPDNDEQGRIGAARVTAMLEKAGMETRMVILPEGHDPDSYFRETGREGFVRYIKKHLHPPHLTESLLLCACLLYPEATAYVREGEYPFVNVLEGMLKTDVLPFGTEEYRNLLTFLADRKEEKKWQPAEQHLAEELLRDYTAAVRSMEEQESASFIPPEKQTKLLQTLLYLYIEYRLQQQIATCMNALHQTTDPTLRQKWLQHFDNRHDLLRHISRCLDRSGMV